MGARQPSRQPGRPSVDEVRKRLEESGVIRRFHSKKAKREDKKDSGLEATKAEAAAPPPDSNVA